ncbi:MULTISPECIES: fimbrial protein [Rahnella]|uniref:Fimbrial protein n=1 Tax=Rahnella laticis TaxID=2787622 RepID=A0ABS0E272_9GAMM|nr:MULTISPECIES: fimbrial protein [Rahnella]MBF7979194.1 fimbrial protein [Rahnella laticis]MBF7999541.1 fimbrial protein [Rahnella sp. LAC-M12]
MKNAWIKKSLVIITLAGITSPSFAAETDAPVTASSTGGVINFEGSVVNTPCIIQSDSKSQTVLLGDVTAKALKTSGAKGPSKGFNIQLVDCDLTGVTAAGAAAANYSTATVKFTGTTVSGNTKALALGAADNSATNVGVEIAQNGTALALDGSADAAAQTLNANGSTIPFTANLVSTAANPTAGAANAMVNFTVTYK